MTRTVPIAGWLKFSLKLAGLYNLIWGAAVVLLPNTMFRLGGLETPQQSLVNVQLWQCIGMIVGVYGIGYFLAAADPARHWPIVLVGFLGKIFGPIGMIDAVARGHLPASAMVTIVFNDLIWWLPFGMILWRTWTAYQRDETSPPPGDAVELMRRFRTQHGPTLAELSAEAPVLVVFLRHLGCIFCREALGDVSARRAEIESSGTRLAFVHQGAEEQAEPLFRKFGLADTHRISDPENEMYRAFDLKRARLDQVLNFHVFKRGQEATLAGYVQTGIQGDGFRMPGAFLIRDGRIVKAFRHATVADRPDYCELARA